HIDSHGPPVLFSFPEPVTDSGNSLNTRPYSTNAYRRTIKRRDRILYNKYRNNNTTTTSRDESNNNNILHTLERIGRILYVVLSLIFLVTFLYIIFNFLWILKDAIDANVEEHLREIIQLRSECSRNYIINRCNPEERLPAAETAYFTTINKQARGNIYYKAFNEMIKTLMDWSTAFSVMITITIVYAFGALIKLLSQLIRLCRLQEN
ncbi:11404_t:CDS:2, partial [Diversispora eburnea]